MLTAVNKHSSFAREVRIQPSQLRLQSTKKNCMYGFDVLLTVYLTTILVINQLNAQILMFIGPCIIVIVEE